MGELHNVFPLRCLTIYTKGSIINTKILPLMSQKAVAIGVLTTGRFRYFFVLFGIYNWDKTNHYMQCLFVLFAVLNLQHFQNFNSFCGLDYLHTLQLGVYSCLFNILDNLEIR